MRCRRSFCGDEDAEIEPVPGVRGGGRDETELDRVSNIIEEVQRSLRWDPMGGCRPGPADDHRDDSDTSGGRHGFPECTEELGRENARIEHDEALVRVMTSIMKDDAELFWHFVDDQDFRRWLRGVVFGLAYGGSEE